MTARYLRNTVLLFGLWLLLSGRNEPLFLALGLVASAGVAALQAGQPGPPNPTIPLRGFVLYLPWLLGRILAGNLHVLLLLLHPRLRIQPKLIRYRIKKLKNPAAISLLANSITLTPGTVTVELNPEELIVHTLDEASAKDVTGGVFEERVRRIFEGKGTG